MQVVENVALISINATLVVQLISFLIFMVLLNRVMIRPLRTTMTERDLFVDKVKEDVVAANEAFKEVARQIEVQESEARQAATKVREEIVEAGQRSVSEVLDQTRQEIDQLKAAAQQDANARITAARGHIQTEAETLADQMVAALLNRRSTN